MSVPDSEVISIQLDRVEALAAELAALVGDLSHDVARCTSTAAALSRALADDAGGHAAGTAHGWAGLLDLVQQRTGAISTTLAAAVASYRAADGGLGRALAGASPRLPAVPR